MPKILVGFEPAEYPSVAAFAACGDCTFSRYDRPFLERRIADFDALVPHLFLTISDDLLGQARRLRVIATPSTGSDHLDLGAMRRRGIDFISLNDDRSFIDRISSTAELTWLLILAAMRRFRDLDHRVQVDGSWLNTDIRGYELQGKTLGIIGYGRLGRMVARYGQAFGMTVLAYDIDPAAFAAGGSLSCTGFDALLARSDVVSLHVKLNAGSRNLIDAAAIGKMKDGVVIVNTARGGLIDSPAALAGLRSGRIAALGLDVCNQEYQSTRLPDDPLVEASRHDRRIIITPHAGGSTFDAHRIVFERVAQLLGDYFLAAQEG